jgi:hypothetical protein
MVGYFNAAPGLSNEKRLSAELGAWAHHADAIEWLRKNGCVKK